MNHKFKSFSRRTVDNKSHQAHHPSLESLRNNDGSVDRGLEGKNLTLKPKFSINEQEQNPTGLMYNEGLSSPNAVYATS